MVSSSDTYRISIGLVWRRLVAPLVVNRTWILGCVIAFECVFLAAAFLIPPTYRSEVVLLPTGSDQDNAALSGTLSQLGGLASLAGLSIGTGDQNEDEALAVLNSKDFTQRFISDFGLMPLLFPRKWDSRSNRWKMPVPDQPTLGQGFKKFDEDIRSVDQDKKTNLVTLQIDWRDRFAAAKWANVLIERLNAEMRARAIARATANITYLEKELETTSVTSARDAIGRLLETQVSKRMYATVNPDYAFRVVDTALVSDVDDPLRPRRLLLAIVGPILGFAFAIGAIGIGRTFSRQSAS